MDIDELYERLFHREDISDIPIIFILRVIFAVYEELGGELNVL